MTRGCEEGEGRAVSGVFARVRHAHRSAANFGYTLESLASYLGLMQEKGLIFNWIPPDHIMPEPKLGDMSAECASAERRSRCRCPLSGHIEGCWHATQPYNQPPHQDNLAREASVRMEALRARIELLTEALVAARDTLAAFGKQAGWLPEQGGYSTTMTEAEYRLSEAVRSIDALLARPEGEPKP